MPGTKVGRADTDKRVLPCGPTCLANDFTEI